MATLGGKPHERQAKLMDHSMLAAAEGAGKLEAGVPSTDRVAGLSGDLGALAASQTPHSNRAPPLRVFCACNTRALGVREDGSALRLCPLVRLLSLTILPVGPDTLINAPRGGGGIDRGMLERRKPLRPPS
jgi:hypothetical protein